MKILCSVLAALAVGFSALTLTADEKKADEKKTAKGKSPEKKPAEEIKPALKEGDKAPDFKLAGSDGKEYTLKQFAGKQAVVIAWFPKAFTGG